VVLELAQSLREIVLPSLGSHAGRVQEGTAPGGDATFAIDARAEEHLEAWVAEHAPGVAFYSEDRGLVGPPGATEVLIVDPIDGTRPAMAGFEAACVSVALASMPDPVMRDVSEAAIVEIKSGERFFARRGEGLESSLPVRLSANEDVERMFWAYGLRGRPVRVIAEVLAEIVDASSVGGGTFDLGSATYDMTRVVTGQLDAYVEPGARLVADVPGMREAFEALGDGAVLNNSPYDLAAVALICAEAGAVVTDAYGAPLGPQRLLGSGAEFQISCVTASTQELHGEICERFERGVERLIAQRG
jgi:myo-inositol-1(or 4)-monophosphatase